MLKLKESAIKTMAGAAAAAANQAADATQAPVNSTAIVLLNKKLRVGFGFAAPVPVVKSSTAPVPAGKTASKPLTPVKPNTAIPAAPVALVATATTAAQAAEKAKPSNVLENEINSILGGLGITPPKSKTTLPAAGASDENDKDRTVLLAEEAKRRSEEQKKKLEEQRQAKVIKEGGAEDDALQSEEAKKIAEEARRKIADEARLAEEKRKAEEAARLAEEKRKAEEAARLAEEKRKAEEARLAAQEKLHQEKLRIEEERLKAREERRQKLALIEKERREGGTAQKTTDNKKAALEPLTGHTFKAVAPDDLGVCLRLLESKLRVKKAQYEKGLSDFPEQRKPLDQKKTILKEEIERINAGDLAVAERNEREIESKEAAEKAKLAENMDAQLERTIEQKLWAIEDQRKEIEKQRWAIEDQINKILAEIEVIESQINQKNKEEETLKQKIKDASSQEKLVDFCLEKNKLEEDILKNINQRDAVSPVLDAAEKRKFAAKEKFQELSEKEVAIKAELEIIERQEKQETDTAKKRMVEQSRWKANSSLKNTIQTKWEAEEKLKNVTNEAQLLQTKINSINEKIDRTQADIATNESVLEGEGLPIRKMRDAITNLFKENELDIDNEILKDIVQDDESAKSEEKAKPAAPQSAPILKMADADTTKPQAQAPGAPAQSPGPSAAQSLPQKPQPQIETPARFQPQAAPVSAIPAATMTPGAQSIEAAGAAVVISSLKEAQKPQSPDTQIPTTSANAAPIAPNPPEKPSSIPLSSIQKPVPVAPMAVPPVKPAEDKTVREVKIPDEKMIPLAPVPEKNDVKTEPAESGITAVLKDNGPVAVAPAAIVKESLAAPALTQKIADVETKTPEQATPKEQSKPVNAIPAEIKSEPKPAAAVPPESATKVPETAAIKQPEAEKKPAEVVSPYREPITMAPATNIREFAQRANFGKETIEEKPEVKEVTDANAANKKAAKEKIEAEESKPLTTNDPGKDIWEDRWGQIKKNTPPAAGTDGGTGSAAGAATGAGTDIDGGNVQILEKPGGNKMMVRILVILLLVAIIGIALALILRKNPSPTPPAGGNQPTETNNTNKKPGGDGSDSSDNGANKNKLTSLATITTIPIITEDLASVPNLILPYTKTTLDQSGYHKLTIQNKKNDTYVGLKQFMNIYKINAPAGLYSSVSDDFILFIFSNKTKNRLGFVTEITDEDGVKKAMTDWEENIVQDTNNFYNLIGRKIQEANATLDFKSNTASNGTVYRSLTFAPATDAYTISYAVYNSKYLVFGTSEESLIKIFDQLPN